MLALTAVTVLRLRKRVEVYRDRIVIALQLKADSCSDIRKDSCSDISKKRSPPELLLSSASSPPIISSTPPITARLGSGGLPTESHRRPPFRALDTHQGYPSVGGPVIRPTPTYAASQHTIGSSYDLLTSGMVFISHVSCFDTCKLYK